MITFSVVPSGRGLEAYQWHRGFAAQNPHILPRPWEDYKAYAEEEQVWCARTGSGDFLGLAYCAFDRGTWELGGLMVAASERKSGLGSTLVRLALGHLLFQEDPLNFDHEIIAHVHAENVDVIPLAEKVLGFRNVGTVEHEWYDTSGRNAPRRVSGYKFQFNSPSSLIMLAEWCETWDNKLFDGRATEIVFAQNQNLKVWAAAFRDMARQSGGNG